MTRPAFSCGKTCTYCNCFVSVEITMTLLPSTTEMSQGSGNGRLPVMVQVLSSNLILLLFLSHNTTWPLGITIQLDIQGSSRLSRDLTFTLLVDWIFLPSNIIAFLSSVFIDALSALLTGLSPQVFLYWPFQGGTSVVVPYCSCCLCLYFGSSIMLVTYFVNFR